MEYLECRLIRQIDAAAVQHIGIESLLLMENAARGVCEVLESRKPRGRILIASGAGNNGGDGLAVARLLAACGIESEIHLVLAGKALTLDAEANLGFLRRCGIPVMEADADSLPRILTQLTADDWIIDALLGTGIYGTLRSPFHEIVEAINQTTAQVLSVDVPSGLNANTGQPCGIAVKADVTVTFVAKKAGFRFAHAIPYLGDVVVRQIGIPQKWLSGWLALHGNNTPAVNESISEETDH
ncbi:MAG: NAD(P)H-hydrate epimerase [Planctomycetota bacterium]|nr:NAD(P)H-hydrate epimerase [Planctomycetota bacterium]